MAAAEVETARARAKLSRCVSLFASSREGTRMLALEAASRLLVSSGRSWVNLFPSSAPSNNADRVQARRVSALLSRRSHLVDFEQSFLRSIANARQLSSTQVTLVADIERAVADRRAA